MRFLLFICLFGSTSLFSQTQTFRIDVSDNNLSKHKRKIARSIIVALEQGRPDIMANYYQDSILSDISHAEDVIAGFYQKPVRKSFPLMAIDTTQAMDNRYYRLYSKSRTASNAPSARIEIVFSEYEFSYVIKDVIIHEGVNEEVDKNSVLYLITCGRPPMGGISRETFFEYEIDEKTSPAGFIDQDIRIFLPKEINQLEDVVNASGVNIKLVLSGYFNMFHHLEGLWQCRAVQDLKIVFPVGTVPETDLEAIFQMTWLKHLSISFELDKIYKERAENRRYKPHRIPDGFDSFKELETLTLESFYSEIPPSIFTIRGLKALSLRGEFTTIPAKLNTLEKLERISIASFNMESFPDVICDLPNLSALTITLPSVKTNPEEISHLRRLKTFQMLRMDSILSLPNSFGTLDSLRRIDYYSMKTLPSSPINGLRGLDTLKTSFVDDCSRLQGYNNVKYLHLAKGQGEVFSQTLESFQNLKVLTIMDFSNLASLPEFSGLPMLEWVTINESKITVFPAFITSSPNIRFANLRDNLIEEIPKEIINMKKIEELNLIKNKITHLPAELCELTVCKQLPVGGNYIESIDSELFSCQREQKMTISLSRTNLVNSSKKELESRNTDGIKFSVY